MKHNFIAVEWSGRPKENLVKETPGFVYIGFHNNITIQVGQS
jgi:hypothetical protein